MSDSCDILVFGGGIAGLWLLRRLVAAGYDARLIEKDKLGGGQTMASQGMIHGGQRYALTGAVTHHAQSVAAMPQRWEKCFAGEGEIDLRAVKFLSNTQIMWPAGGVLADMALFAAAKAVRGDTEKLSRADWPAALRHHPDFKGPVYGLNEKVLEVRSLVHALAAPVQDRISFGTVTALSADGRALVDGREWRARAIVFTGGAGNEQAISLLGLREQLTQRRPLRQIMVRPVPYALHGHGVVGKPKPRMTVTSHPTDVEGEYVWYLGGEIADTTVPMTEAAAAAYARAELSDVFPHINWASMDFASILIDRAEPYDPQFRLPQGAHVHAEGNVFIAWPLKLTLTPGVADRVLEMLAQKSILPSDLKLETSAYPWETAQWQTSENVPSQKQAKA